MRIISYEMSTCRMDSAERWHLRNDIEKLAKANLWVKA